MERLEDESGSSPSSDKKAKKKKSKKSKKAKKKKRHKRERGRDKETERRKDKQRSRSKSRSKYASKSKSKTSENDTDKSMAQRQKVEDVVLDSKTDISTASPTPVKASPTQISSPKRPPRLNIETMGGVVKPLDHSRQTPRVSPGRPRDKVWQHFKDVPQTENSSEKRNNRAKPKPMVKCLYCSMIIPSATAKLLKTHIAGCKSYAGKKKEETGSKGGSTSQELSEATEESDESEAAIYECERGCGFEDRVCSVVEEHEKTCQFVKRKRGRPRKRKGVSGISGEDSQSRKKAKADIDEVELEASYGDTTDEDAAFKTITLYCKRDFLRALRKNKAEDIEREKRKEVRTRRSINSMSEAEQLKLALEASLKTL